MKFPNPGKPTLLVLLLVTPFAAYAAASHDLWAGAYLLTGLFAAVMVSVVIRD